MASVSSAAPVFVVGSMRSGTTLVRLMLDAHPDLAIGIETGFLRSVQSIERVPGFVWGHDWYVRYGLSRRELLDRVAAFYSDIFEQAARREGKRRWGDKTPFHVWFLDEMHDLYPDAKIVAVVRHPGGVAASLHEIRTEFRAPLVEWVEINHEILRHAPDLGDQLALVRYEDLLDRPREVMGALLEFLGLEWSDSVLCHHDVQMAKGAVEPVEGGTLPTDALDASRAWRWLARVGPDARRDIDTVAGDTLRWLGYDSASDRVETWPGIEAGIARGDALAQRLASEPLTLVARPTPPETMDDLEEELETARRELRKIRRQRSVRVALALSTLARSRSIADARSALRHARGLPNTETGRVPGGAPPAS